MKTDKMKFTYTIFVALISVLLSSCSLSKFVPQNSYLLNKVQIVSDIEAIGKEQLSPYLRQKPNPGIFGTYRLQLRVYNISGLDSTKWYNKMWRKMGEPPVILNNEETERTRVEMQKQLSNKGFINSEVKVHMALHKKKANLTYFVKGNAPYLINNINYNIEDDSIRGIIYGDTINSLLKRQARFDVDVLMAERQRIESLLKRSGFYYFNKDYLYIEADSSLNANQVNITLKARPMLQSKADGTIEKSAHKRLKIRSVSFIPWYNPELRFSEQITDTVLYANYKFYYNQKKHIRPSLLTEKTFIIPGNYYDEKDVEKTYVALNGLGIAKYVNISFREREAGMLDCFITISPNKTQGFSLEVEGTNTDGDIGAAINTTYHHRNLFKGSEQLNIKLRTAYQPMGDLTDLLSNNSLDLGGEVSVRFPKFMFPFLSDNIKRRIRSNTELSVSYNFQTNPWYTRILGGTALRYIWVTGSTNNERYVFDLVDANYVYLPSMSDKFKSTYLDVASIIRYSYEDHFIVRTGFSFSKTSQRSTNPFANFYAYKGSVETAGNTLSGICSLLNVEKEDGAYKIGNIRFSQYAKADFDYAYNRIVNSRNKFVYRFNVGLAYPYGNDDVVPFEKRFFAGGANSVRGWSVRTLGPGLYKSVNPGLDFMQSGDIKLDLNFEYRFKLFWLLEGAAFIDGGNIWTIKDYSSQQGGLFYPTEFYKQLAYSYGLGLRFDFTFFLFRIDMGVKLYDPTQTRSYQWRIPITWEDTAFHFAIGYPF